MPPYLRGLLSDISPALVAIFAAMSTTAATLQAVAVILWRRARLALGTATAESPLQLLCLKSGCSCLAREARAQRTLLCRKSNPCRSEQHGNTYATCGIESHRLLQPREKVLPALNLGSPDILLSTGI